MKLLFISNMYPPYDMGGYEQWCYEVAIRLRHGGHDVHVLTGRYGLEQDRPAEINITRTLYLDCDPYHYAPVDFFLNWRRREAWNHRELERILHQIEPDIVCFWGMWLLSHKLTCFAEQKLPGRVAYYLASYWPIESDPHTAYWQLPAQNRSVEWLKKPFRDLALTRLKQSGYPVKLRLDHSACCSSYVRDYLVQRGVLSDETPVLYGGIDPEPFLLPPRPRQSKEDRPLRLLYFGTLRPAKGMQTALEALAYLKTRGQLDRVELTLLGGGYTRHETDLRALAKQLDIRDKVTFAGRIPRDEIPQIIQNYDVFLFTSIWPEPFGRTIVEAMAAGLAVIGSDVGGSREIFDFYPENMLYEPGNAEALAGQIHKLLDNPDLLHHLAQVGRQIVQEWFTLDRMVDDIEVWLEEIFRESFAH